MIHKLKETTRKQLLFVSVIVIHLVIFAFIVKLLDLGADGHSYHINSEPR